MNTQHIFIGIDLGTTAVKLIAVNAVGEVLKTVSKSYPIAYPHPNWSEQNPNDWWDQTVVGIKELLKELPSSNVKAISLSGQMHGLVTLDEHDQTIRPAILWNDQRSEAECQYLNEKIGISELCKHVGNRALTGFTAPKVLWMAKNEPQLFDKIEKIMLPKDYIAYQLSGVFATDLSDASGTLYLDVANREWSSWMMDHLNISMEQLPTLYESYESIGVLKEELALELGLPTDVNVVIGGGDQAVAAVGGGVVESKAGTLSLGTSGVVFVSSDTFFADDDCRLHSFCHANGKYHLMGVTLSAAQSLKWWMESVQRSEAFDAFLEEAEGVSPENELYFLPYLMGERSPHNDPHCRGAFVGLHMTHTQAHMTRSILEGVAFSLKDTLEIMRDLGIEIDSLKINGGGSKSDTWCQIVADIMGVSVEKLDVDEGPAYGAALLASVGAGAFKSVEEACRCWIQKGKVYEPNVDARQTYEKKHTYYQSLYERLNGSYHLKKRGGCYEQE